MQSTKPLGWNTKSKIRWTWSTYHILPSDRWSSYPCRAFIMKRSRSRRQIEFSLSLEDLSYRSQLNRRNLLLVSTFLTSLTTQGREFSKNLSFLSFNLARSIFFFFFLIILVFSFKRAVPFEKLSSIGGIE